MAQALFEKGPPRGISGVGVGLRIPHMGEVLSRLPKIPWFEVLADNHLVRSGPLVAGLEEIRAEYPLSLHCVGMSLAGTDPLELDYLTRVRDLADRLEVDLVSDHLCFTRFGLHEFHDLLPVPYTKEALAHVSRRITQAQEILGRRLLVENASAYLAYQDSEMSEGDFLADLARRSGCSLLVDVNNAYVNETNLGTDARSFFTSLPPDAVAQAHLAGFDDRGGYLLDAHNNPVSDPVWSLYRSFLKRFSDVPTLVEWDNDLPDLDTLIAEATTAEAIRQDVRAEMTERPRGAA
ncbi:MAG: DUF692 domain-containing protein [Pseudomonadota bacterium]